MLISLLNKKLDTLISPEPMSGCWLWMGPLSHSGYPAFGCPRILLHRLMWERTYGPIPDGLLVCHKCDIRCCLNPSHLFLGTARDNLYDMIRKGRARYKGGKTRVMFTHCPAGHPYDDANTYWRPSGGRKCRACNTINERKRQKIKAA